jgi:DNA-binding NtrC family response regulator
MVKTPQSLRVLVVDDELLLRWSISETLKQHGHSVVEAEDGASARRALDDSSEALDAVVLDYRLPDTDGLKLLALVRRLRPDSPVILMTAFGTEELVEDARRLGAYAVIDKPFEMRDLESVLAKACASK